MGNQSVVRLFQKPECGLFLSERRPLADRNSPFCGRLTPGREKHREETAAHTKNFGFPFFFCCLFSGKNVYTGARSLTAPIPKERSERYVVDGFCKSDRGGGRQRHDRLRCGCVWRGGADASAQKDGEMKQKRKRRVPMSVRSEK